MTTITITWNSATVSALAAIIPPAAGRSEVAAVLQSVRVDATTMVTTDRYAVAEWKHGGESIDDSPSILLPIETAKWLARQTVTSLTGSAASAKVYDRQGDIKLVIHSENGAGSLSIREIGETELDYRELVGMSFREVEGNYPAVSRLFPDDIDPSVNAIPTVNLNAKYLARAAKAVDTVGPRNAIMRMQFQSNDGRPTPGPVLITACDVDGFRYLLMPTRIY